jgi:tetratricopeptide (TPR) repeat protein
LPRSTELRNRGKRAWSEGRYADAINDFEESVTLSPDPRLYYNLGLSYEKVGRYPEALRWLTRFRAEASRDEVARASSLETRLALLQNRVAVLTINTNVPGARVLVRDAVVGVQPAGKPLAVSLNAGRALVEIVGDGYRPYYKEHTLPGGGALELSVSLNREAAPVTVIEKNTTVYVHSPAFWSQWWFWAGASVLLAGGAATVYALSTEKAPNKQGNEPVIPTALPSGAFLRF